MGETDLDALGRKAYCLRLHFVFPFIVESEAAFADRLVESIARFEQAEAIRMKWRKIFPDFDERDFSRLRRGEQHYSLK